MPTTGGATVTGPPRIAVTLSDPRRAVEPDLQRQKNGLYLQAVVGAGGDPIPLDAATPAVDRDAALASMDGLLLSGGPDLDPALYGEKIAGATMIDAERDALDLAAWRAAGSRRVPVLGICRGFQAINVFTGGRLAQQVDGHRSPAVSPGPELHRLRVSPGSQLGRILRPYPARDDDPTDLVLTVNSYHHQGVRRGMLAPGLVATGWGPVGKEDLAADPVEDLGEDLVEALEGADPGWFLVGVQCHPERTETTPHAFERLFAAFVHAAG